MTQSAPLRKLSVGIYGGSGYVGLELIRLLNLHPQVTLRTVTSREHSGKKLSEVHRSLAGLTEVAFSAPEQDFSDLDILFLSVPHTQSSPVVSKLAKTPRFLEGSLKIIDLGADFRLSPPLYAKFYGEAHPCPELIERALYGVPEINREDIKNAQLVSNPGCFANCTTLALTPLAQCFRSLGINSLEARVSAITGSSGSGVTATSKTHHPERNESLSAYEVLTHRHIPEIERALSMASGSAVTPQIKLVPHSGPFSRGIFATIFCELPDPLIPVSKLYEEFAARNKFIRIRASSPRLIDVRGSNFCDISLHQHGKELVILSTLDNLVKGAAGNAIQNMNLMSDFSEHMGLLSSALVP
jgi:N-acetyl-gamma-glutamyl-phosphate reductase common form